MSEIFTSTLANTLKETLEGIVDDDMDGIKSKAIFPKWMDEMSMSDNYYDWLETGGPGLIRETEEGEEIPSGQIFEGYVTRVVARKFAMKLNITEETLEDNKYEEAIRAAKRLKRALWKTADIDAANILNRLFDSNYVGGDGKSFGASDHDLPGGGSFSNQMTTPVGPSNASFIVARAQVDEYPGHDGITEGYDIEKVVFPVNQRGQWDTLLGSDMDPVANNYAAVSVVKRSGITPVANKYWSASDTNYLYLTDCEEGFKWLWRRKPRDRSWVDNDNEVMKYSISSRWGRTWVDPRCGLAVNA